MLRLFAVLLFAALPASAFAGCYNYDEHPEATPPKVVICHDGKCSETTKLYECGNVYGAQFGYKNGWKFEVSIKDGIQHHWAQSPSGSEYRSFDGITCYSTTNNDENACLGMLMPGFVMPPEQSKARAEITRRLDRYIYPKDGPDTPSLFEQPGPLWVPVPDPRPDLD